MAKTVLLENIKMIFYFVLPIARADKVTTKILYSKDQNLVSTWNSFNDHAPLILKAFQNNPVDFYFPKFVHHNSKSSQITHELNLYISLITHMHVVFKRSLFDYLIHGDNVQTLTSNNHIARSNTIKMNSFARSVNRNQKRLGSSLRHVITQENNILKNVKVLTGRLNQAIIDIATSTEHQQQYNLIEQFILRLDNIYLIAMTQQLEIQRHINEMSNMQQASCHVNHKAISCPIEQAHFTLTTDLFYLFRSQPLTFTQKLIIKCLPFKNLQRFQGHNKMFIIQQDKYIDKDGLTFQEQCFMDKTLCAHLYSKISSFSLFNVCNYIYDGENHDLIINCPEQKIFFLANDNQITISDEPVTVGLKSLPIRYEGQLFTLDNIQLSYSDHYAEIQTNPQHNLTNHIVRLIQDNRVKKITTPAPMISDQIKSFILPKKIEGSHIVLFLVVLIILSALL